MVPRLGDQDLGIDFSLPKGLEGFSLGVVVDAGETHKGGLPYLYICEELIGIRIHDRKTTGAFLPTVIKM
jgi:hypothetical protein